MSGLEDQLNDLRTLMSLVLTSIFICAGLIAIGTPVAAILIWRNRHKLLPKPKPEEARQEASIGKAAVQAERLDHNDPDKHV